MKKTTKYIIGGILIIAVAVISWLLLDNNGSSNKKDNGINSHMENVQDPNLQNYLKEQDAIMDSMMKDMENIPKTGDTALDFLYGMIPHHESAIAMSESLLEYGGENTEIKQIAENIIKDQAIENEDMKKMIKELEENPQVDEAKENAYLEDYNKMLQEPMSHDMSTPKSVDEAYTEGMIMHHEMAVDMSETILKHTENEMIKKMAQDIIEKQNKEITEMKILLESMK